ncbi:glycosyl transferase family 2 [Acidobacteria bacterium Mor1]|nr:glycosyl transferase family 2 [Acidobacteria bacterium Mor1]
MDPVFRWLIVGAYFAILLALSAYGAHRWYLIWLYARHRRRDCTPARRFDELPVLTVQLPLFNEMYVAPRLIDAVCNLDYPRDRLEIQVLDDSTDETTTICREIVERKRAEGIDIKLIHRTDRTGFKAGALEEGQQVARGEFIAIFDADFVPPPDFAQRLIHHFTDDKVGMVQARWGHLNPNYSALTRVQSMLLDGHFVIEHTARNHSGRFFNFNGTAGIWRKTTVADAGGWQHDTLTEDLDLSYRAQMKGWKFVYLPDEVTPAELPVEVSAFKTQQHRWAKGSIQTARKLLPRLLRSDLPFMVKTEAVMHLTANIGYVLMVALAILVVPSVWLRGSQAAWQVLFIDLPIFTLSSLSVAGFYIVAQREALGSWRGIARWIPFLMAIGIGLSVNNAKAVLQALVGHESPFRRTPKYNLNRGEGISSRKYRGGLSLDTWIELALTVYFTVGLSAVIASGLWGAVPFLMLFQIGYGYTALMTIVQSGQRGAAAAPATK